MSFVRTLLTCWMIVVATGAVVSHRHANACEHIHGYGWASLPASGSSDAVSSAHRHFVFLGVELGAIPDCPEQGDTTDVPRTVSAIEAPATTSDALHTLPDPELLELLVVVASDSQPLTLTPSAPLAPAGYCPLATHARTGVLRT
ncbi:MAG: hypothetical protein C0467_08060 [Planctomycetaceae bacterium]|nr:hypothetical protein [Planctomycetaceae bacterium]